MTTTYATHLGPTSDPTAVMGRRIFAWFLDGIIYLALIIGVLALVGEYKDVDDAFDGDNVEFCDDLLDANPDFDGSCLAPPSGDRVYLVESSDSLLQAGVGLGWFIVNFVLLQGLIGASVGKLLTGLRVVNVQGARAGVGRCLVRSLAWIIDGLPGLPLVGGIAAVTSNGHRRVGDMIAGTRVVGAKSVGSPVEAPAAPIPAGAQPWGAAPQPSPTAPPQPWSAPPAGPPAHAPDPWGQPTPPPPGAGSPAPESTGPPPPSPSDSPVMLPPPFPSDVPSPPPTDEATSTGDDAPTADEPDAWTVEPDTESTAAASQDPEDPSFDATATVIGVGTPWEPPAPASPPTVEPESAPEPQPAAESPSLPLPDPQWDAARNTYIQWEPNQNAWLQWDATANQWKPIDT